MVGLTSEITGEVNVNVNDRFNIWNHRWSQFQLTGPPFTSLFTDEASMIKCLAYGHKPGYETGNVVIAA